MRLRPLPLAALAIAAYVLFLVVAFPAHYAALELQARTANAVQLREAAGTVWNGRAQAVTVATAAGPVALEHIAWRWQPAALLAGRMAFDVSATATGAEARGELARSFAAWELSNVRLHGDATAAARLLPWLAPWRPEGALEGRAERLAWDGHELSGEAAVEWRDASLALSTVRPLGHYRAQLAGGTPARVSLATLSGPLQLAGQGTWTREAGLAFDGQARGEGPSARALEPLLDLFGPRRPDGSRALAWRMR